MSLHHFPIPYEGEFWHGTLCRLHKELGAPQSVRAFHHFLVGARTGSIGSSHPRFMEEMFERIPSGFPLTPAEFLERHSLQKFLLNFVAWGGKKKMEMLTHLKTCPQCREDDTKALGVPVWRTIHQAEPVTWCQKHEAPLEITESPVWEQKGVSRTYDTNYSLPNETQFIPIANPGHKKTRLQIAKLIECVLALPTPNRQSELGGLWGRIKEADLASGYQIKGWKVLDLAQEKFGDDLQNVFGIDYSERGRRIVANILSNDERLPVRNLFFYALLDIPFGSEMPAVERIPMEKRLHRKGKVLLTNKDHDLRKEYLKAIKGKLPSEANTELTKLVETKFPTWVRSIEKTRLTKRKQSEAFIQKNDAKCAELIREASGRLRSQDGAPIWLRRETIIRETGQMHLCKRCMKGPLTAATLAECVQSKEDIIQARLHWARNDSTKVLAQYEFLDKAKLRGMQGVKSIPGIITLQIRWKTFHEERAAMLMAWDEDAAKSVRRAADTINSKPTRPEWIRLASILRESGDMAEKIMACRECPATKHAILSALDSRDTITKKRYEWAEKYHPEILEMAPYDQKYALGLRKREGSSKNTFLS